MNTGDAKEYLARREIPQLFESLLTGLMYYRPDDPVEYLENCLKKVRELGGTEKVRWDTFVGQEKKSLPPLNGGQSRRSFFRNVLPDSPSFPYRRYDRLPPIHQFSIESDSDLSETAELIEEYEVFDPSKPRPKVILVIGKESVWPVTRLGLRGTVCTEGACLCRHPLTPQICTPDLVLFLACANSRLKERLEKRAEQQGRPDDNPKATERRLANFKQNAIPLVKYFQEKDLIITLDADRDEEEVFYDISVTVDSRLFPTKEPVAGKSHEPSCMLRSALCHLSDDLLSIAGFPEEMKKPRIIFVVGAFGECEKLEQHYGLQPLCPGELLRRELQVHSERGRLLRDFLERGEQLPADMPLELMREAMAAALGQEKGFLIEGFPRSVRQAEDFEAKIGEPSLVLLLECSTDTMCRRLSQTVAPPLRPGDSRDAMQKRVESFCSTVELIAAHYERRKLLHKIDAERPPEDVFVQICHMLDTY
uniref:Adenylate kinase 5 n=1 Tax=Paramormyrops kingsleyae TaxID=1676925 RepID=A0A3B3S9R1_9TELE